MMKSVSKVTINTGNVLNLIDIKKKAGQNVTEELSESIKLTLFEWSKSKNDVTNGTTETQDSPPPVLDSEYVVVSTSKGPGEGIFNITRHHDDVQKKIAEEERKNLKIGVKVFINEDSVQELKECLDNVFGALSTDYIDNVTLAYSPKDGSDLRQSQGATNTHFQKSSPITLTNNVGKIVSSESDAEVDLADQRKRDAILPGIKVLWSVLEGYVKEEKVYQLGVADVGLSCLKALHSWSQVKPTIAQINLATCCVVPPQLQEFCKAHDVQLLTHADPPDLLSIASTKSISDTAIRCDDMEWCARYQVHIKCRGVLALKGYVCKATICSRESDTCN